MRRGFGQLAQGLFEIAGVNRRTSSEIDEHLILPAQTRLGLAQQQIDARVAAPALGCLLGHQRCLTPIVAVAGLPSCRVARFTPRQLGNPVNPATTNINTSTAIPPDTTSAYKTRSIFCRSLRWRSRCSGSPTSRD